MIKNFTKRLTLILATLILLISNVAVSADSNSLKIAEKVINEIVSFNLSNTNSSSIQSWINGDLTKNAGTTAEWYIFGLSQSGSYNFSSYENALSKYLENNEIYSASSRQKYALALIAAKSSNQYIQTVLDDSIGQQGIMSYVYGLHLLNNGYKSKDFTVSSVKSKIISLQLSDGGWALTGSNGDTDVTSMTVQSLAPYYKNDDKVKDAVDKALDLLSKKQLSDGDYSSYGVSNPESTAQVVVALSSLGIDCQTDSRFIKKNNTLFDGLLKYRLSNGSFAHKSGGGYSHSATVQTFYSLVSYTRMSHGKSPLYILDSRNPSALITTSKTEKNNDDSDNKTTVKNNKTKTEKEVKTRVLKNGKTVVIDETEVTSTTKTKKSKNKTTVKSDDIQKQENNSLNVQTNFEIKTSENKNGKSSDYKIWCVLGIIIIVVITLLILLFTKKLNKKNLLAILLISVVVIALIFTTNFQSVNDYYNNETVTKENSVGTVTISISCDTLIGKTDSEFVPSDGVILKSSKFEIQDGDTVYDILKEATAKNKIHIESSDSSESAYIQGINYIYEFDYGDLSGWNYFVNGISPSVSCGEYKLSDGDIIEWKYTCNLGEDLK